MSVATRTTAVSAECGYAEWAAVGAHQWESAGGQRVVYQAGPDRFEPTQGHKNAVLIHDPNGGVCDGHSTQTVGFNE